MNSTASYKTYGVQDSQRSVSQPVGQSASQPKKGLAPAKRSKFNRSRSDPAGSSQNNHSHLQGPYGGKPSRHQGLTVLSTTNKSGGLAVTPKGKVFGKPVGQGMGGIDKLNDRHVASAHHYPPSGEYYPPSHTSTPHSNPPPGLIFGPKKQ